MEYHELKMRIPKVSLSKPSSRWLPSPGNVIFTLLIVGVLVGAQFTGILPLRASPLQSGASTSTIAYQGRLADADGNPLTATINMIFRLYDIQEGGGPLWEEQWTGSNGVQVSDGLFNVMLGSLNAIPQSVLTGSDTLWLGITAGTDDEMAPRVQLGTVPFAVQALTVPDGSVTAEKIEDGAVTSAKLSLPHGSVCRDNQANVTITSEWERVPIPDLVLSFSLDEVSEVLIWSSGTYHFDAATHFGAAIFVDDSEFHRVTEKYSGGGWSNYAMLRTVTLAPGTHTIHLSTFAQQPGTVAYGSGCLEFQVIA